ncbi:MAG: hypothetical protein JNJ56_07670 [Ignavibacteria bacterium]|nr:hypothetical protein [Ignavibacteria bacterium]
MKRIISVFCLMILTSLNLSSQTRLAENFDYPAGDSINLHGWSAVPGSFTNRMIVTTPGLSFTDYPLSGIGNAVTLTTSGQDAYRDMSSSITLNSVYASFMVKVTSAQRPGDYFAALLPSNSNSFFAGRVHARFKDGSLEFGLTKASPNDTNTMSWISGYSLNTTYLIVLKYTIVSGSSNDLVSMYVMSSGLYLTEPPFAHIGPVSFSGTSSDAASIGRFALRQGTANRAPGLILDGILVSDSWFATANFYQRNASFGGLTDFNSDWGELQLKFTGYSGMRYLNLKVDAPGLTTSWQIQNMILYSFYGAGQSETQGFAFDIGTKGINVESINYGISITDYPLLSPPLISNSVDVSDKNFYVVTGGRDSNFLIGTPDVKDAVPLKAEPEPVIDTTTHKIDSLHLYPNQECQPFECVPTAVSNSLKYLKKMHNLNFDTLNASIDTMKKALKYGEDFPVGCSMNKWPGYKKDFIESKGIPVTTRVIDSADVITYLDSLAKEIDNNQDIELDFVIEDNGQLFDHCVNLVGIKKVNSKEFVLNILNDIAQGQAGGQINEPHTYRTDTNRFTAGTFYFHTIRRITIECPSPPKPTPVEPQNNSSGNSTYPEFDWEFDPPNPLHKTRLQISSDPGFILPVYDLSGISGTSYLLPQGILLPGSQYYWRIRGLDSAGAGPWSDVWSFSTSAEQLTLTLKAYIEGFYNPFTDSQVPDTAIVQLRNNFTPYTLVDQSKAVLGANGTGTFSFSNAANGVSYYIVLKHRNSIETWSANGEMFAGNVLSYDFSSFISQAYGFNMTVVNFSPLRFAVYGGDTNQDGVVDAGDISNVENDILVSAAGYLNTDLTGDDFVDASDLSIAENNATNSVNVVNP